MYHTDLRWGAWSFLADANFAPKMGKFRLGKMKSRDIKEIQ